MIQIWNLENSIHILTIKSAINFKLKLSENKLNEIHILYDTVWSYSWRSENFGMRSVHSIHGPHATDIYVYFHQAEDNLIDISLHSWSMPMLSIHDPSREFSLDSYLL